MPKLVVNIGVRPRAAAMNRIDVACSLQDEIDYSRFVGQTIWLAGTLALTQPVRFFATATLQDFASGPDQTTMAHLVDIKPLLADIAADIPDGVTYHMADDGIFDQMLGLYHDFGADEALATAPTHPETYGDLGRQVRSTSDGICSFSSVPVRLGEGVATPIRPVTQGGDVHVKNFIYLHDEPAALFTRFAWTVGPDFEIIVDSWSMGTSVLSTVNETGKLRVGADQSFWPDADALAWHRQQFFDRLR